MTFHLSDTTIIVYNSLAAIEEFIMEQEMKLT